MSLPVPNLDDKRWTELVEEAVGRIPLYSDDWTDHNVHDPGRTFIELFAWLAEFQRYRLAQTPRETVLRFLRLAGVEPRPLRPARVDISFGRMPTSFAPPWQPAEVLLLPKGTPVTPIGNEQLVFQLTTDAFLTGNGLVRVTTEIGDRRLDQSKANEALDITFFPFRVDAPQGAILELEFERWFGKPEIHLVVQLDEEGLPDMGGHADETLPVTPSAQVRWQFHDGSRWSDITVLEDQTQHFHCSGRLRFQTPDPPPGAGSFQLRCTMESGRYEIAPSIRRIGLNTVEALQIQTVVNEALGEGTGRPDQTVSLQHVPLLEDPDTATLEVGDILDPGAFLRRLSDAQRPDPFGRLWELLDESLQAELTAKSEAGRLAGLRSAREQSQRDLLLYRVARAVRRSLTDSGFLEKHPSSEISEASIGCRKRAEDTRRARRNRARLGALFPDLVPAGPLVLQVGTQDSDGAVTWENWRRVDGFDDSGPADQHFTLDILSGQVRFGNGLNGRAPQVGQLIRARYYRHCRGAAGNLPAGQAWELRRGNVRLTGRNLRRAREGRDPETIEDARLRAQERFHQRIRGLTAGDFEELSRQTPGLRVARAKALPNQHPDFPGLEVPGAVTVIVLPAHRQEDPRRPQPGLGFIQTVDRHLQTHRLVTTEVNVVAPRYRRVALSGRVYLRRRSSESQVVGRLKSILENFFDPLVGGPGRTGWPFGRPLFPSEIYSLMDQDPGVDYVVGLRLNDQDVDQPIRLEPTELPDFSWAEGRLSFVAFEARSSSPEGGRNPAAVEVQT